MTEPKVHLEIAEHEWIDDCFRVFETHGIVVNWTKEGRKMLTGMKKEDVVSMTRWHLMVNKRAHLTSTPELLVTHM